MFSTQSLEEFIVEEILPDGRVLERDKTCEFGKPEDQLLERDYFTYFVLQKTDWNTHDALNALAKKLHIKPSRFNAAGNKDKKAITVQRVSAFALAPQRLLSVTVKDVKILGAWKTKEKIRLGDLAGNRFTITLTKQNCSQDITAEKITENARALNYQIKNFFGPQRFGSQRQNTARIGGFMLKCEYEQAIWELLTGSGNESAHIAQARSLLREKKDFQAALRYFPQHLKMERRVLEHLAAFPNDFVGAIRTLPRTLALLFIHAFQSELFNEYVGQHDGEFVCESNSLGFPDLATTRRRSKDDEKTLVQGKAFPVAHIIGYETELSESEKLFLENKAISQDVFKLKSMPELSSKGTFRATHVVLKDFEVLKENPLKIRFSLPAGAYATVALDQLLKES